MTKQLTASEMGKIATVEIICETSASITILTDEDFSNSVFVFQINKP